METPGFLSNVQTEYIFLPKTCLSLARTILIHQSSWMRPTSAPERRFINVKADGDNEKVKVAAFPAFFFHGGEMGRGSSAKNTSRAAFCRQRRTKQSSNESRVAPQAQPSTSGVIHILLIAGRRRALLIDTPV